ncbi:MAG TPA: alpha/beta hydrolase [Prolixibacteraceae bacterium]|nr:alpha/beta hydrolase [Prolixibacteraceae bacterium]
MKTIILTCLLFALSLFIYAQNSQLQNLDINLSNVDYPYEVHFLKVQMQNHNLQMAYMDVRSPTPNLKNIVLLHGKNFNGAYWETTIRQLVSNGYRVIVPDQIGFGKSSKPFHIQYSFQQLALNTKALLDSLGIRKTAVLGHSMGGMLATRFALMFPDITEKLILENPIGLEDYKLMVPYTSIDDLYKDELSQNYDKIKQYQLTSYYDNQWKPEYEQWVDLLAGWTLNEDYPVIAWNAALTADMIFTQPVVYEFPNIKCPTLLIIGTRDRTAIGKALATPEMQKTMGLYNKLGKKTHDKIPNSKLVELDNVGHLPHIEAFDRFIKPLVEFLNK